jgi:small subunit ribosomal protein S20
LVEFQEMAHHQSAKKRIRRNARRAEINQSRLSRVRSFIKAVETAIGTGDKTVAQEALKAAQPELHRGVRTGVMHRNTVARKLSRLSRRIKSLA